jgi:hypothetical protein
MGRLDRTATLPTQPQQRLGLEQDEWLCLLSDAHDHIPLLPYEVAEIEECSITHDDVIGTGGTGQKLKAQ